MSHGDTSKKEPVRGLSREVLRWIQSLDLAYSVKNVSRDFANGFLIAEILSRYDSSIHMHSYDNGCNIVKRKDNWHQLCKFFLKAQIQYTDEEINYMIHYDKRATVQFINRLYTLLTQRKVQQPPARKAPPRMPPFSKETASLAMKQKLREPEMTNVTDMKIQEEMLRQRLEEHEQSLRDERKEDPERFQPSKQQSSPSRSMSKIMRGPTRPVGAEQKVTTITVKQVQVRAIERNVAGIRASKELGAKEFNPTNSMGSFGDNKGTGGSESNLRGSTNLTDETQQGPTVAELLDEACRAGTEGSQALEEGLTNSSSSFEANVANIDGEIAARVYEEVESRAALLAPASVSSPRNFLKLSTFMNAALKSCPAASIQFEVASRCFNSIAVAAMEYAEGLDQDGRGKQNQETVQMYFTNFTLPHFVPMLRNSGNKRSPLLSIAYGFCIPSIEQHKAMIKTVQELVADQRTFLYCLTAFSTLEGPNLQNQELLDLYTYYCSIAVGMPSPSLRAAAISVLCLIAPHSPEEVSNLFARFQSMADEDTWWEVQAQLVVLASILLGMFPVTDPRHEIPMQVLTRLFTTKTYIGVQKAGLSYLASVLKTHPSLTKVFVDVLLTIPEEDRLLLLSPPATNEFMEDGGEMDMGKVGDLRLSSSHGNGGSGIPLYSLPIVWDGAGVAQQISTRILESQADNLEVEDAQVLASAISTANLEDNADAWISIFDKLLDYLYVALCDIGCCSMSVAILQRLIVTLQLGDQAFRGAGAKSLTGALKLLFGSGDDSNQECQRMVCEFLQETGSNGPSIGASVTNLLQDFKSVRSDLFEDGLPLAVLLESVQV